MHGKPYPLLFDPERRAVTLQTLAERWRATILPAVEAQGGGPGDIQVPADAGRLIVARYVTLLEDYKRFNQFSPDQRVAADKIAALSALAALCIGGIQSPQSGVESKVAASANIGFTIEVVRYVLKLPGSFSSDETAREFTFFARTFYDEQKNLDAPMPRTVVAALVMACRLLHFKYHKSKFPDGKGE